MDESAVPTGEVRPDDETSSVADGPGTSDEGELGSKAWVSGRPWRKYAAMLGGAALTAAGAVVVTLAATHKTAVTENAKAYVNGMSDALEAVRNGYDPYSS